MLFFISNPFGAWQCHAQCRKIRPSMLIDMIEIDSKYRAGISIKDVKDG